MTLRGLIFDFDGLILDTELPGFIAWKEIFESYDLHFTFQQWHKAIGTGPSAYDPALDLCTQVKEPLHPSDLRERQLARVYQILENIDVLPGVLEVINEAKTMGLKMAVASSSPHDWVLNHLTRLDLVRFIDFILTAEDVRHVKPQPDLYLLALEKMGLKASETIVFEDSPNGITAGKAADIFVVAVPNQITKTMDTAHADMKVSSFHEINLTKLSKGLE